ncbi:MAG: hypothetical protein ACI4SL_11450 [Candidatus Ornithospirochaeta sp.]
MFYYHYETTGCYPGKGDIETLSDKIRKEETMDPTSNITDYPEKPDYEYHEIKAYNIGSKDKETNEEKKLYFLMIPEESFMSYVKSHNGRVNTTIHFEFRKGCNFKGLVLRSFN